LARVLAPEYAGTVTGPEDWYDWHDRYDDPRSRLARRLLLVQERIRAALGPPAPLDENAVMFTFIGHDVRTGPRRTT
jgi:hypothetical protein